MAITPLLKTAATGIVTGYSISPTLPAGLYFNAITGAIGGTPTAQVVSTTYTITVHGPGGTGTDSVVIQTSTPAPTVSYPDTTVNYAVGSAIVPITKTGATGIINGYSISPALPTGLVLSATTGAISGTPRTVSAPTGYTITVTGPGGTGTDSLTIQTSTAAPTVSYTPDSVNYALGSPISPLTKSGATGIITGYSIAPALPAGLSFSPITASISGTPSALSPATDYTITVTGPGGTGTDVVNIAVTASAPTVSYAPDSVNYALRAAISPLAKSGATGIITGYSITPALPAGLTFSPITGTISGTPSALSAATDYTITVTGPGGTGTDVVNIAVTTPVPTVSYTNVPQNFNLNAAASLAKSGVTGIVTSYSINPALPAGLVFSPITGAIGGTPSALSAAADYVITATGPGGAGSDTVNIAVTTPAPTVSYTNTPQSFSLYAPASLTKSGVTGIITGYSINPALPAGMVFSAITGSIGGNPSTLSAAADYVITVTGPGGTGSDTVNIAVTTPAPTVTYSHTLNGLLLNVVSSTIAKTGASGIITGYSISPALPAGLYFSTTTGAIGGTPSVLSAATGYQVTVTGPGGTGTDSVYLAVTTPAPTVTYTHVTQNFPVGVDIGTLNKTGATGLIASYAINPALPAGLSFSATTGRITGVPSTVTSATKYAVTVTGPGGTGTDSVTIATVLNPPILAFAANPYSFVKSTAITAFRADNTGGPITGWSISNGSNGASLTANTGLVFSTTTGRIQGTPVYVSPARTYVVTANGLAGASDTETVSIAVTLVAKGAVGESFSFRVTGGAMGYNLRMPKIDENTENVTVTISDLSGRKIWSQGVDPRAGVRELAWDGRDQNGRLVAGGMYMVRVSATGEGKTSTVTNKAVSLDK